MYHERLRDAIARHIDKDLGSMALPRIPTSLVPFTVAEYFPTPGITPYHDPRQHAVSLAYIVPVEGDCQPSQDRKSTRLNSSHVAISYAVFCLKKKKKI